MTTPEPNSLETYLRSPPDTCGKAIQRFLLTGMDIVPACTRLAAAELQNGENPTNRRAKLLGMAKVQMSRDLQKALVLAPTEALRHSIKLRLDPLLSAGVTLASQLADLPANQFMELKRRCLLHGAWTEPYLKFQQDIELANFALRDIPLDPVVTTEPTGVRAPHHWQLLNLLGNSDRTRRESLAKILHEHRSELQSNVKQINEAARARRLEMKRSHESAIKEPGCVEIGTEFFESENVRRTAIEGVAEEFLNGQDLDPDFQLGRSICRHVLLCVGISDVPLLKWSMLELDGPDAPAIVDGFVDEFIAAGRLKNGPDTLRRIWRLAELSADNLDWLPGSESGAAERGRPTAEIPMFAHAEDFTWIVWQQTKYDLSKGNQAEAMKYLWQAWEAGGRQDGCGLSEQTICAKIGSEASDFRLAHAFRNHPLWNRVIRPVKKGVFALFSCESPQNPTS